jgi:hypothetical protein
MGDLGLMWKLADGEAAMKPVCITVAVAGLLIALASSILPTIALAGDVAAQQQAKKPADCLLILEGKHIEKLVLREKQGKIVELVHPAARVTLPAGEYQIDAIEVEGGYSSRWSLEPYSPQTSWKWPPPSNRLLVLAPDKPCQPNIGTPLKPEITAKRVGGLIKVTYNAWLRDGGARPYMTLQPPHNPTFAVCQGDRNVTASGAGSLEFG